MKTLITIFLLSAAFIWPTLSKACINPDSVVQTIVKYDTIDGNPCDYVKEVEIRLTNIRLMNENPNKICACALASFAAMFTELHYVAFVDSGTNNPYQGFAAFNANPAASGAWNSDQPGHGGWSGLIASVINSGLKATDPVEMVIRAKAPANTIVIIDSGCVDTPLASRLSSSSIGTDAWDADNQKLEASHQSVRSFDPAAEQGSSMNLVMVDAQHFVEMDTAILNNMPTGIQENAGTAFGRISIYPNPAINRLNIKFAENKQKPGEVELINMLGHIVTKWKWNENGEFDVSDVPAGIYFIRLNSPIGTFISNGVIITR